MHGWTSRAHAYGGQAGYLITTFLAPGKHTFTPEVTTVDGHTASATVVASVGEVPAPPAALEHLPEEYFTLSEAKGLTHVVLRCFARAQHDHSSVKCSRTRVAVVRLAALP